jgi:ATP-dependent helicase HrpA
VAELVDLMRERRGAEPRFLMMEMDDLRDPTAPEQDTTAFPGELPLENRALPLAYAYKPGQADDGVTLEVSVREAEVLTAAALDWAVPGHLEAKVEHYLRNLPKELRRAFVPLAETARRVAGQVAQRDRLTARREALTEALAAQLREGFQIAVDPALWAGKPPPDHLRVRVRVVDDDGRELCASRELAEIQAALHAHGRAISAAVAREDPETWRRARTQWEKPDQLSWTFGDIPARVQVGDQAGVPVFAFPGLRAGVEGVALRLFKTPEEARDATRRGLAALLELQLRHDLGWTQRDLGQLRELGALTATVAPLASLQEDAFHSVRHWVCDPERVLGQAEAGTDAALGAARFAAALERAKADLRGLVPRLVDLLREILELRHALLVHAQPYPGLETDMAALLKADFLRTTSYGQLAHFPRYLKGMKLRADRWRQNPAKDADRARQLAPYVAALAKRGDPAAAFRWLLEEFRVSLFAQELGTAEPVSALKLDRALAKPAERLAPVPAGNEPPAPVGKTGAAKPADVKPDSAASGRLLAEPAKKSKPLKNLGGLDNLFRR